VMVGNMRDMRDMMTSIGMNLSGVLEDTNTQAVPMNERTFERILRAIPSRKDMEQDKDSVLDIRSKNKEEEKEIDGGRRNGENLEKVADMECKQELASSLVVGKDKRIVAALHNEESSAGKEPARDHYESFGHHREEESEHEETPTVSCICHAYHVDQAETESALEEDTAEDRQVLEQGLHTEQGQELVHYRLQSGEKVRARSD
jgi:hypothetical protein